MERFDPTEVHWNWVEYIHPGFVRFESFELE